MNYNILDSIITKAKESCMPEKHICFNKYKHKRSHWITQGILKSIEHRDRLYKQLKTTNPDSSEYTDQKVNLKTFNNIFNSVQFLTNLKMI